MLEEKKKTERRKPISENVVALNIFELNSDDYNRRNEQCVSNSTNII